MPLSLLSSICLPACTTYYLLFTTYYLPLTIYYRYITSIWTGIGVTIAFTLIGSGVACFVLRRAEIKARGTPEAEVSGEWSVVSGEW